MNNPYSLVFGIEPPEHVSRIAQTNSVVDSIMDGSQRVYMIAGVRGSGKTVFLTEIENIFRNNDEWEVIELSTERDMLNSLAAKLGSKDYLVELFKNARINLSVLGIGVEVSAPDEAADIEVTLDRMFKVLARNNKRLLVAVDEIVDNQFVREFASVFQILIRGGAPVSLIMTGLYENIDDLQNEKNLTFLHRAPKIFMEPLSIGTMAASYRKNLNVDEEESIRLAQMTRGYSYAFQVLGHFWLEKKDKEDALVMMKQYLEEYVYDKIWSELSEKDKKIAYAIAISETKKVKDIREECNLESNEFAPYKKRLVRKGIIGDDNGYARFALPLFDEFVRENYYI